ncbi:MAG: HIT family protein [Candidatus Onthoplasma sp.]
MLVYDKEQIKKFLGYSAKDLTDAGICPTCFNKQTKNSVFGDDSLLKVYEDKDIECLFVANPRADGHMMIAPKRHYHDLTEATDEINTKIIKFAKQLMIIIKDVFVCERVYLCTMSDGPMNHYHIQLIPRYANEKRGSENFVKPRHDYVFNKEKFDLVKQKILNYVLKNT